MNAISGTILTTLLVAVVFAPRRWALLAILAGVFFLTQGHAVNLGGLAIHPIRFLVAAACARVLLRREITWSQLNRIDWTLLLAYNYTALIWTLQSSQFAAEQLAFGLDPTLCYLALRGLLAKLEELRWVLRAFVFLLVPFTILVTLERLSGETAFAMVGANWALYVREGIARCSGAFRHASLLGSIAAAFLAMYAGLWWGKRDRQVALVGVGLCAVLVVLTNSGGPLTSALAAMAGWMLWPLRNRMRVVRYSMLAILVLLTLFMEAPIWYLPFKISLVVGGGGYHRGQLMESAWNDLSQWWLVGMELRDTLPWIPYAHGETGGADITNQFVVFGIKGGLAAMVLLILVLSRAFSDIGEKLKAVRLWSERERANEALLWGLGVAIVVHAVSWLGIAYFDQSWVVWLLHVAAVSASVESADPRTTVQAVSQASPQSRLMLQPVPAQGPMRYGAGFHAGNPQRGWRRPTLATARKEKA